MKLPTCARHGPILGVPRTAGRDSGLSLARLARQRGPSTSASLSVTTSLIGRTFPVPLAETGKRGGAKHIGVDVRHHLARVPHFSSSVDQPRFFLTCPAISCEFHKPSVNPPVA